MLRQAQAAANTELCHGGTYTGGTGGACPMDAWDARAEPCGGWLDGNGWDDLSSGWIGVVCQARGEREAGRIVSVDLYWTDVGGELLPFFGRLGALRALALGGNPALSGALEDLADAPELRSLHLWECPLVRGNVAALEELVHLGGEYTVPGVICGNSPTCNGRLSLANTGVHGAVAALRALPGLGEEWGSISYQFSACSTFRGCDAAGLALISVSRPLLRGPVSFLQTDLFVGHAGRGGRGGEGRVRLLRGLCAGRLGAGARDGRLHRGVSRMRSRGLTQPLVGPFCATALLGGKGAVGRHGVPVYPEVFSLVCLCPGPQRAPAPQPSTCWLSSQNGLAPRAASFFGPGQRVPVRYWHVAKGDE